MNYSEFRQLAQQSAERYYKYLQDHNKGISEVEVSRIQKRGRRACLTLRGVLSPAGMDSIQLQIDGDRYPAERIRPIEYRQDESLLILNPDRDIFDMLPVGSCDQISVVSSLLFLVERVRRWYENHTAPLGLPVIPPAVKVPPLHEMAGGTPSEDQYAAVRGVLSSPLSYVWGAPGTGKTRYVLSNCVLAYLREDKKVLLIAPTNNALDQMLSGVIGVLRSVDVPLTCIRRLGVPSRDFQKKFPTVCENQSSEKMRTRLSQEVQQLREQVKILRWYRNNSRFLAAFTELHDSFLAAEKTYSASRIPDDKILSTRNLLEDISRQISFLDRKMEELTVWRDSYPGRLSRLFFPGKYAKKMAALDDFARSRPALLQDQDFYQQKLNAYTSANKQAESAYWLDYDGLCGRFRALCRASRDPSISALSSLDSGKLPAKTDELIQSIRSICDALAGQISPDWPEETQLTARLRAAESALSRLDEDTSADWENIRVLAMTIDRCIGATVSADFPDFTPEHIFMDEAAYCSLIKGYTLLGFNRPLTLLGDHAQLPPVCEMSDYDFRKAENCPVFFWAQSAIHIESAFMCPFQALYLRYDQGDAPDFDRLRCFPLSVTYRFGPSLSRVLANLIYTKDFRSANTAETSIKFISAPSRSGDIPRTSRSECAAIVSLVKQLTAAQVDFAVLTPYKKQITLLYEQLRDPSCHGKVMTVHASQGREFHTVILSVVDTTQKFFVNSRIPVGRSVLNTAISRSRSELILVLDDGYWRTQDSQMIGQLLQIASPYTFPSTY